MVRIALVTCLELPEPDPDEELLLDALRRKGMNPELLPWDDQNDPGDFDLCILRSCWNYYENPEAFLHWITRAQTRSRLMNPADIVRWNVHKGYLQELAGSGIPIIPMVLLERGEPVDLLSTMQARKWDDVVLKPAVSAASFCTQRFHVHDVKQGQVFLETNLNQRDMLIQPYIPSVENTGEKALVWIDGELTHAVIKYPRFAGDEELVSGSTSISDRERRLADKTLACVDGELLYARVDVVEGLDEELLLSELELMEPSLFLLQYPPALERFVAAIERLSSADN